MDELCGKFQQRGNVLRSPYINTYDKPLRSLQNGISAHQAKVLREQWMSWSPDIIHLNKQNLEDGLDLMGILEEMCVPSICTIHLTQTALALKAKFGCMRDWMARRILRRFRGVFITVSEQRAVELRRVCPGQSVVVVPNGVPLLSETELADLRVKMRVSLRLSQEEKLIVAVGRFVDQKRPLLFLSEAIHLKQVWPQSCFFWIGAAVDVGFLWGGNKTGLHGSNLHREWKNRVRRAGLGSSITLMPWQEDITPYLAAADWYFHTAAFEGLPFSLLEAMAAGVPTAVTPDIIRETGFLNRENTLVLEPDMDWRAILEDAKGNVRRADSARELIRNYYSREEMGRSYQALYEKNLSQATSRDHCRSGVK
jgi:glycosyltransferase involved in cell wall biosynthesis